MKKIITHLNPDLDAVVSVWLIKRFLPGWEEAKIGFEGPDEAEKKEKEADDPGTLRVDVGQGKLDHHQTTDYLSAAQLCLDFVKKEKAKEGERLKPLEEKALNSLVKVVTEVDQAADLGWEEVSQDRYYFNLSNLIDGLKGIGEVDDEIVSFGFRALESLLLNLKNKFRAEEELGEGIKFETSWGKAIGVASGNRHAAWLGERLGYCLVVLKYPDSGGVRMYARPDSKVDLTQAYSQLKKLDPESDWFLHISKKILLNQSATNPGMRPTKLSLEKIIELLSQKTGSKQ